MSSSGEGGHPADHRVDRGKGALEPLAAAGEGAGVGAADLVGLRQEEVAGVVGGVGLDEEDVPLTRAGQVPGDVGEPLVVEVEELEVGVVVDDPEGVAGGVLQEVSDLLVELPRQRHRGGVSDSGPDLRHEELEALEAGGHRHQLGLHVPVDLLAVDEEGVAPPLAPLALGKLGDRSAAVPVAADQKPVVAVAAAGVSEAVVGLRLCGAAPRHPASGQGPDGQVHRARRHLRLGEILPVSASGRLDPHRIGDLDGLQGARVEGLGGRAPPPTGRGFQSPETNRW